MKVVRLASAAVLVAAVAAFVGVGLPEKARSDTPAATQSITVSGDGSVKAVPDQASLSFGVVTQGDTATAALAANSAAAAKVIAALKHAGIAAADIQTEQISLQQRTNDNGDPVRGYVAANSVDATLRDLSSAGAVIDAAVAAGANAVSGPSLSRSDQNALYRQALTNAVADARAKAQTLATAAGLTLGRATTITEGSQSPQPVATEAKAAAPSSTPVEPGTQEIDATVTVTFAAS